MSLLVGGAELIYRGVYNIMGLYLIVTGTIASLFTLYEMQIHVTTRRNPHDKMIAFQGCL